MISLHCLTSREWPAKARWKGHPNLFLKLITYVFKDSIRFTKFKPLADQGRMRYSYIIICQFFNYECGFSKKISHGFILQRKKKKNVRIQHVLKSFKNPIAVKGKSCA